ncbi:DUF3077 domain-containing protein [Oxalobacter vibrioformis]|uniref:DUF3077 domain-containing protein n=1 Tax=Oxalobacter vibrioformis TaxID=933080 RepID=A0A9E9P310_9BURK|nr:DUF3077 domain-containing protein [Oxalobacter vibrioformis]WAW09750.1 DUF3077 domain-containing protein [Oxalobacter vibrioformis]
MSNDKAVKRTLQEHAFFHCNSQHDSLFAVRENVPITDALAQVSCLLSSATSVVQCNDSPCGADWAVVHLIDMAQAVVEAVNASLLKQEAMNN